MATKAKGQGRRNRMLLSTGWAAGIGMILVEMEFGMDYVLSHVAGQLGAIVGWLPMIGGLMRQIWG